MVNSPSFVLQYIGDLQGIHEITLTVENQSGAVNQANFQIDVLGSDFEFVAELQGTNTIFNNGQISSPKRISLSVNPFGEGQTFTYKFVVNEGSPTVRYNASALLETWVDLAPNQPVDFLVDQNNNIIGELEINCQPNVSENIVITVIATSDSDVFYTKQFNFVANP